MPPPSRMSLKGVNFGLWTLNFDRLFLAPDWPFPPIFSLKDEIFDVGGDFYSKWSQPKISYIFMKIGGFLDIFHVRHSKFQIFCIRFQYPNKNFTWLCINRTNLIIDQLCYAVKLEVAWKKGNIRVLSNVNNKKTSKNRPKYTEFSTGFILNNSEPRHQKFHL